MADEKETEAKVVDLRAKKAKAEEKAPEDKKDDQSYDFEAEMERNKKAKAEAEKRRLAANKSVLRIHRIKN